MREFFILFAHLLVTIARLMKHGDARAIVAENGLLQSVWNSMIMVRRNLWPTLGIILLTNVLGAGLMLIWQRLVFASWGMVIAIMGNAFVGSGLVAAVMIFYMDRYRKWQEELGNIPQTVSENP